MVEWESIREKRETKRRVAQIGPRRGVPSKYFDTVLAELLCGILRGENNKNPRLDEKGPWLYGKDLGVG